jgi:anti-sigma-K factor RskA
MQYRNKPELQDRLASEYVLGTLRGRARLRFQTWLRDDAALRRTVNEWEARLVPMASGIPEVRPARRVWTGIESRIAASAASRPASPSPAAQAARGGWWDSLAFWRGWGLVASGCVAALVGAIALRQPDVVEVPVVKEIVKEVESAKMQPSYVAILRDKEGRPVLMAYAPRNSHELWVKRLGLGDAPPEHGFELWGLLGKPGEPPKLLGMLPKEEKATIRLAAAAGETLQDFPSLALTIEPARGSGGTPTGPVVASGDCFRFW